MKTICVSNQKGEVGKTTTAVSLAACLAQRGYRTLLLDLDPQANATMAVGLDPYETGKTLAELMALVAANQKIQEPDEYLQQSNGFSVLTSNLQLAGTETTLINVFCRETVLKRILEYYKDDFDYER